MIEKSTTERVLEIFQDFPTSRFHLRELSRKLNLSMSTIIIATDKLAKEGLIIKEKGKVITEVSANRESNLFRWYKKCANLFKIYFSGLIEYLIKEYNHPQAIVLFGSYARGEDIERSDVDIAITTEKSLNLNLTKFERAYNRKISIHEIKIEKISEEFQKNLNNGIVLEGTW
jgi:predicted nucleotidyltransferase